MPVTVLTDEEADRALSLRVSRSVPLPPELSLCDSFECGRYYEWLTFYQMYGLESHAMVRLLGSRMIDSAMAASISRSAPYLDRISHYAAWLGGEPPVSVADARSASPSSPAVRPLPPSRARPGMSVSSCQTGRGTAPEPGPGACGVRLPSAGASSDGVTEVGE